jgi:hypothetical protein
MAKTPTVSKKELADSGFTNLRDYLNDKRGLTRKGSPMAIKRADPVDSSSREGRRRGPAEDISGRDSLEKQMSESATDMAMAQRDEDSASKFLRAGESSNSRGSSKYRESGQAMVNKQDEDAAEMRRESRGMKKGGAVKKMASGGSVSASRRADGIAQRGKTRGKMC